MEHSWYFWMMVNAAIAAVAGMVLGLAAEALVEWVDKRKAQGDELALQRILERAGAVMTALITIAGVIGLIIVAFA